MTLESTLMPTKSWAAGASTPHVRFYDVRSADGTRLRAWTNDADGPTVLLCNGLGTNPYAWPSLLEPDCGVRVISWNHRGVGGSDRPDDRDRVDMDAFVEDALAVMDDAGRQTCVFAGWSMGVNLAFEIAVRHAERVDGIFAVAGVPGDTFSTMLAPLHLPRPVTKRLMVTAAQVGALTGKAWNPVTQRLGWLPGWMALLRYSGFMLPSARHEHVRDAVREFLTTDVDWYAHMALHASRHTRVSLSHVAVPVSLVAGTWDLLAGTKDMQTAAARIADSEYIELNGSHFLPLEHPDQVLDELLALLERVG